MPKILANIPSRLLYLGVSVFIFAYGFSQVLYGGWWYPFYALIVLALISASVALAAIASVLKPPLLSGSLSGRYYFLPIVTFSFVIYLLYSNTHGYDGYLSRQHSYLVLAGLFSYLISYFYLSKGNQASLFFFFFIFSCVIQSVIVFYQYYSQAFWHPLSSLSVDISPPQGGKGYHGYVLGTFGTRGTLSLSLMVGVIFALSYLFWGKLSAIVKLIFFWIVIILFGSLSITMSRAGYVGVSVGVFLFVILSLSVIFRYSLVNKWVLSILFLCAILASFVLFLVSYQNSISLQLRISQLFDDSYRESLWLNSLWPLFSLNPHFGMGGHSFDPLSIRYLDAEFSVRHVFAHNDWLQLMFEFGWVGLLFWGLLLLLHLLIGVVSIFKIARQSQYDGAVIPQDNRLAFLVGSFSAVVAFGVHSLFEYQANVLSPVILLGVCLGLLGSLGFQGYLSQYSVPNFGSDNWHLNTKFYGNLRKAAHLYCFIPLVASFLLSIFFLLGAVLVIVLIKPSLKPEYYSILAEKALYKGDIKEAWGLVELGAGSQSGHPSDTIVSDNPRLLALAAEVQGALANSQSIPEIKLEYLNTSAFYWKRVIDIRPRYAYAYREGALANSWAGNFKVALPMHLRAIALDPQSGLGYEYFGLFYWLQKEHPQAKSLLNLGSHLPGGRLSKEYLPIVERDSNGVMMD